MRFTKMQGAGNDFIVVNNMEENIPEELWSHLAVRLCARRLSLGADGLMIVEKPQHGGDYRMVFYNCDGSRGEMCGNGARCIARYGYENGLAGERQRVETTAGDVYGRRCSETEYEIRLNDPSVLQAHSPVDIDGVRYDCGYAEIGYPGIPHAVVELPHWDKRERNDLFELGRALRYAPSFPKGANVTFVRQLGEEHFAVLTYERCVEDFTLACGTGCGSAVAVLTLRGRSQGRNVRMDAEGGTLHISLTHSHAQVRDILLRGPTRIVATGETGEVWE